MTDKNEQGDESEFVNPVDAFFGGSATPEYGENYRAGFVAILGKPNAGKSTLANLIIGEKLIAVSGLPQTTRDRIKAIYSDENRQIIFVDLPGLVEATDRLNEALRQNIIDGLNGVDVVLHLIDCQDEIVIDDDMAKLLKSISVPIVAAVNKIDSKKNFSLPLWQNLQADFDPSRYQSVHAISATASTGVEELLDSITGFLPQGTPLYDPDDITDRDLRFLSSEMIREKIFHYMHQELPYASAVQIERFEERDHGKWFISATIFVERDTQKGMIIGKGGANLKRMSLQARKDLEHLCGHEIFLELFVKVAKNWRKKDFHLREFGYKQK